MCAHAQDESLTANFGVFRIHQLLTHNFQFASIRTQGPRVCRLTRDVDLRGASVSANEVLNLGYQHQNLVSYYCPHPIGKSCW